jgi:ArsR family transcriptional regulator
MNTTDRSTNCCALPIAPASLPPADGERLVAIFKALGDATRLDVFRLIAAQPEPLCVCDVVDRFNVSQPTISHHLKVLRDAGVVQSERRGTNIYYSLAPSVAGRFASIGASLAGLVHIS